MNGAEENKTPKELYEEKKAEREREKKPGGSGFPYGKIFAWILLLAVLAASGWYGLRKFGQSFEPKGPDRSAYHPSQGAEHIAGGASHPPYDSNPPSSGWHYASEADGGFYDEDEFLADETVVHNLEHGDIWIAYRPGISEEDKDSLKDLAGRYTIVSPRKANEYDISLVAWERVDSFNLDGNAVPKNRIEDFIKRYDNKGPEKVRIPGGF